MDTSCGTIALLGGVSADHGARSGCPDKRNEKMNGKDTETMYVDELKKALFEKCDSIAEFLEIMEAIEDRVYGTEESPAA